MAERFGAVVMFLVAVALVLGLSRLLALAGEPQAVWFWGLLGVR